MDDIFSACESCDFQADGARDVVDDD